MKRLLSIAMLFSAINISANEAISDELLWVDEKIEAIKPERVGVKRSKVASIRSPFVFLRPVGKATAKKKSARPSSVPATMKNTRTNSTSVAPVKRVPMKRLYLSTIINKSALIGGKWYKIGDSVSGYTLSEVKSTSVILTKNDKKLVLSTDSTNRTLKFKN